MPLLHLAIPKITARQRLQHRPVRNQHQTSLWALLQPLTQPLHAHMQVLQGLHSLRLPRRAPPWSRVIVGHQRPVVLLVFAHERTCGPPSIARHVEPLPGEWVHNARGVGMGAEGQGQCGSVECAGEWGHDDGFGLYVLQCCGEALGLGDAGVGEARVEQLRVDKAGFAERRAALVQVHVHLGLCGQRLR